jgi:CheY-like chemotaxis protein
MLPDLDGIETLKVLKSDPRTKDVPVILCSNMEQENVIKEGLVLGAKGYLVKASYTPRQMYEKVIELLFDKGASA